MANPMALHRCGGQRQFLPRGQGLIQLVHEIFPGRRARLHTFLKPILLSLLRMQTFRSVKSERKPKRESMSR